MVKMSGDDTTTTHNYTCSCSAKGDVADSDVSEPIVTQATNTGTMPGAKVRVFHDGIVGLCENLCGQGAIKTYKITDIYRCK